jgi:biotin transporter BioY
MLNLIIFAGLFFILVFSTFFVVQLPFIVFFYSGLPHEVTLVYSDQFISTGHYSGNLQIPVLILCALLLNPRLSFFFMLTYFLVGFSGYPIFFYGGGPEYLRQPSIGYLLSFFPVIVLLSILAWKTGGPAGKNNISPKGAPVISYRNYEKFLFNSRYLFLISLVALLLIHLSGLITAFVMLGHSVSLSDIIQVYFSIPFLSQFMLIIVISVLAANFNRLKYFFLEKYMQYIESVFKTSRRRPRNQLPVNSNQ